MSLFAAESMDVDKDMVMDGREFVDALRVVVRDGAVADTLDILQRPPGRKPSEQLLENSAWYNSLNDDGKRNLSLIIRDAVSSAIFGVLCVLDGVRVIENGGDKGRLELRYVKNGVTIINPSEGEMLHELW